jgi:hypothetical protein
MPDNVIDQALIDASEAKFRTAVERYQNAVSSTAVARQKLQDARSASQRAVDGKGDISAIAAETGLHLAEFELRVAEKVEAAALAFRQKCDEWKSNARGLAHAPLYFQGIRERIAAAAKADRARALLEQADVEHAAGLEMQAEAIRNGHPNLWNSINGPRHLLSEAAERAFWENQTGLDLEAGTTEWSKYIVTQAPE